MQTVEMKDDVGNLLFTVSSKNSGAFLTPTPLLAHEWFKRRLIEEIEKYQNNSITASMIQLIKRNIGDWFDYSLERIEFNQFGELVRFEVKQSIRTGKLELCK